MASTTRNGTFDMRLLIAEIVNKRHNLDKKETFRYTEVATEGIATAMVADVGHYYHGVGTELKGWFEGVTKKRKHTNEVLIDTIDWLKDADKDNRNLQLDMGSFKTWMKTSETFIYRYFYLLTDSVYNEIVSSLKKDEISELEDFFGHFVNQANASNLMTSTDSKDRKSATRMLDSIRTIKDLIVIVNKYKARVNLIYDLMEKRDRSIKGFPFQLMLAGASDLRQTVKKIVNLAI